MVAGPSARLERQSLFAVRWAGHCSAGSVKLDGPWVRLIRAKGQRTPGVVERARGETGERGHWDDSRRWGAAERGQVVAAGGVDRGLRERGERGGLGTGHQPEGQDANEA